MLRNSTLWESPSSHSGEASKTEIEAIEREPAMAVISLDPDTATLRRVQLAATAIGLPNRAFRTAERFLAEYSPEITGCLVLETQLPGMSGLELQAELLRRRSNLMLLFLSAAGTAGQAAKAVGDGAIDFIRKPIDPAGLSRHLMAAAEEGRSRRQRAARLAIQRRHYERLASRELQVLRQVLGGRPNKAIGRLLSISDKAVETYRKRLMQKLEVKTLADLVRWSGTLFGWQFDHLALLAGQKVSVVIHRESQAAPLRGTASYEEHKSLGAVLRISLESGVHGAEANILISEREWRGRIETRPEYGCNYSVISPLGRGDVTQWTGKQFATAHK